MRVFTPESAEPVGVLRPYSIFLAGGITGCPDWQKEAIKLLEKEPIARDLDVYNPRRETFDVTDASASDFQIEWEHKHLRLADTVLFWFPKEGQCMITLLELGWALGSNKNIHVACHPEYVRAFDVRKQTQLSKGDDFPIDVSLEDLVSKTFPQKGSIGMYMTNLVRDVTGKPQVECMKALVAKDWSINAAIGYLRNPDRLPQPRI